MPTIEVGTKAQTVRRRRRPRQKEIAFDNAGVHMIGIGGCGMRAAARLLMRCGARVSGSDRAAFEEYGSLTEFGAKVHIGQCASNVPEDAGLVVVSAAVPEWNEELVAARAQGCRVIKYAELLGELMQLRTGVAVAGTHGKSTTAALAAYLFRAAGLDPSYVIGANVPQLGGGSGVGMGEHFLVEACEFDRSFLHLRPRQAAILNIEADHLDCYGDLGEIVEAFAEFANGVSPEGLIVAEHGSPTVGDAVGGASARVETFGFEAGATWRAINVELDRGRYAFDVTFEDQRLFRSSLGIAGKHNVSNALAAIALAWNAGATRDALSDALQTFEGVDRRMSHRGTCSGITVIDDYAHHPTEVRVTLEAVRARYAPRRVWVVFQPHQHSRTRLLMEEFARSFGAADEIIVPDIYGSRDSATEVRRTGSELLAARIGANGGKVRYVPSMDDVADCLERELVGGDLVVTMGAGDVWKLANELVERLQRKD